MKYKLLKMITIDLIFVLLGAALGDGWQGAFVGLLIATYIKVLSLSALNVLSNKFLEKIEPLQEELARNAEYAAALKSISEDLRK